MADPKVGARYFLGGGGIVEMSTLLASDYDHERDLWLHGTGIMWVPPGFDDHITYYLSHELGHMLHEAVKLSFKTVGKETNAWTVSVLNPIWRRAKKAGMWGLLSGYAEVNVDEMVAESVAEAVFSKAPRPLALEVYKAIIDRFNINMEGKKMSWSGIPESVGP
jgi:hypothetical protein